MRWAVVMVVVFGCAPDEAPRQSAQQRQAVGMPAFFGDPGALLGSSLAECPGGGFVAGAPGTGSAWQTGAFVMPTAVGAGLGRAVACVPGLMLAGGDAGIRKSSGGGVWVGFSSSPVLSLSRAEDSSLPLLVGGVNSVSTYDLANGTSVGAPFTGNGLGAVVKWFPGMSRRFAVTRLGASVQLYDFDPMNNLVLPGPSVTSSFPGFGKALAVGDLFPTPGLELAVGADNAVFIYAENGTLVTRLTGIGSSFGSSLAIQRSYSPGLDVLIAGEPALDLVQRFIGDAGSVFASVISGNAENFGASVAIDSLHTLAVGAPTRGLGGGVYIQPMSALANLGEAQACTAGMACVTEQCMLGSCVGGVFCETGGMIYQCIPAAQFCSGGVCFANGTDAGMRVDAGMTVDAGRVDDDAGTRDSGMPGVDAGRDAGVFTFVDGGVDSGVDAGVVSDGGKPAEGDAGMQTDGGHDAGNDSDAGPMIFTTSGCSGVAGLPIVLLGLGLMRRPAKR